ncbi:MAG: RNA-binding protein [Rhizomicrobium sp.]|nr:RNA-binding protein [Rhizomicrobium sp.]
MTATPDDESALRERRCIACGEVLPEDRLVRFVVSPDGEVIPDLDAKLPGRGIWLSADRALMAKAMAKNDFSKAAKTKVSWAADLPDHVERLLVTRMQADLGMARRAGLLDAGFDQIVRALDKKVTPAVFFHAADASEDGRRKIFGALRSRELEGESIGILSRDELSFALGRENVVHAAIRPSSLADRLIMNAKRLAGLRGKPKTSNTKGSARPQGQTESTL